MRASNTAKTVVVVLWFAFAFVTWNVVFDRHVYVSAVRFTQEQIQRHQRGERVSSIEEAFTPQLRVAALQASMWGGAALAVGLALAGVVLRRGKDA
jgi:hypothetical protein